MRLLVCTIVFLALGQLPAAADPERGHRLAQRWCIGCHVIGPNTAGGDAGPAFPVVAARPGTSFESLRNWLADTHPPMPDLNLSATEFDDLADYILSLKP